MSRHPKTNCLIKLALFLLAAQSCWAQTPPDNKAGKTQADNAEYDAPENDIGLVSSERGFRLEVQRKVMPVFPDEALRAGAQGVVVLSLYQDADGVAAKIKVAESPHPALTRAAIKAVEQWKWRRFVKGGIGRPILSKLTFRFVIDGGAGSVEDPPDDEAFRNLRDIPALRLKATWPD